MGIVLGEAPHPHQAVHHPGPFVAVDGAEFRPADWQFPVAAQGARVGEYVERAVHRSELVFPLIHLHRAKHALGIKVEVSRGFPEADVGHVGGIEQLVTVGEVGLAPEVFDEEPHAGPPGVPKHQPSACLVFD